MTLTERAASRAWRLAMEGAEDVRWRKARSAPPDVIMRAEWRAQKAMSRYSRIHARETRLHGCARDCCARRKAA
jgi:hypothetical protein